MLRPNPAPLAVEIEDPKRDISGPVTKPVVFEKILLENDEWIYKERTGPKPEDWAYRS